MSTNGRFQKGRSGNPGGRPKAEVSLITLAREHTEEAIKTLVQVMRSAKSETARALAADKLIDRGWGKALQETNLNVRRVTADQLSDDELTAIILADEDGSGAHGIKAPNGSGKPH